MPSYLLKIKKFICIVVPLALLLLCVVTVVDKLTNDTITIEGVLYKTSYTGTRYGTNYYGHYILVYKGVEKTKSLTYYESDWKNLSLYSKRQFTVNESFFQHGLRDTGGNILVSFLGLLGAATLLTGILLCFITDNKGKFKYGL